LSWHTCDLLGFATYDRRYAQLEFLKGFNSGPFRSLLKYQLSIRVVERNDALNIAG